MNQKRAELTLLHNLKIRLNKLKRERRLNPHPYQHHFITGQIQVLSLWITTLQDQLQEKAKQLKQY